MAMSKTGIKTKASITLKWIGNILLLMVMVIVVLSFFSNIQARRNPGQIPSVMGVSSMSVLSGSMRPMLQPGDMIFTQRPVIDEIKIDDVLTYRVGANTLVTHRVVDIVTEGNEIKFQTKGDANNTKDSQLVAADQVVGTYLFRIPKGGYIANFIRSPIGITVLIIFPISLMTANQAKNMLSEREKNKSN
ncbi:signal peptidase I [Proteinivorax hydrogeniformans]|uniref:Signal peptidase I n=1 Tax=Proteinivorax hydrogeniformans TaxID=1826727 RepID=A0AAU8HRT1_9FIRM